MTIGQYYRWQFPKDLHRVTEEYGHEHEDGMYISTPMLRREYIREHVEYENMPFFYCFLSLTVLLDELMYAHFREQYPAFHEATKFPKVELSFSNYLIHPWNILRVFGGRLLLRPFSQCAETFLRNRRYYFRDNAVPEVRWEDIDRALTSDADIGKGPFGDAFFEALNVVRKEARQIEETRKRLNLTPEQRKAILAPLVKILMERKDCLQRLNEELKKATKKESV